MMCRPFCCIFQVLPLAVFYGSRATKQAAPEGTAVPRQHTLQHVGTPHLGGRLVRFESNSTLDDVADQVVQLEGPLFNSASDHQHSSMLDLWEIQRHMSIKEPPPYRGAPTETTVTDIKGEMELACENPQDIYLSTEALTKVQEEIARIANVDISAVTAYFRKPSSLVALNAKEVMRQSFTAAVNYLGKFFRTYSLFADFYIVPPEGRNEEDIRATIAGADKSEMSRNLGGRFAELTLIPAANKVRVVMVQAKREDLNMVEPGSRSGATGMASQSLLRTLSVVACGAALQMFT